MSSNTVRTMCLLLGGVAAGVGGTLWALRSPPDEVHEPHPAAGGEVSEASVALSAEEQATAGVTTWPAVIAEHRAEVAAFGALQIDPDAVCVLRAAVPGVLHLRDGARWPGLGDALAAGAVVAEVWPRYSPAERVDLQQRRLAASLEVDAATAGAAAADAALARTRRLHGEGRSASDRELEEATLRAATETARLASAREAVTQLDGALTGDLAALPVTAPIAGAVIEVLATAGEAVEAGQPLLRVAAPGRLLARVTPALGQLPDASLDSARLVVAGAGEAVAARVVGRDEGGNLWLRPDATLPSTFVAGAPVTAWLPAGAPTTAVEVPRAAVVHHLGRSFVFVAEPPAADGETRFELRELPAAAPSAAGWFVPLGDPPRFSAGEPIVTGGAAVLLSLFVAGAGEDEGN